MPADGSRSRTGCLECRRRKRRCGQEKPACLSCTKRSIKCPYLLESSRERTYHFAVQLGQGYFLLPSLSYPPRFVNLSSVELPALCPLYEGTQQITARSDDNNNFVRPLTHGPKTRQLPRSISPYPDRDEAVVSELFQYYFEVVSSSRVYVNDHINGFRSSVIPIFCTSRGPLMYAVLALSAADRRLQSQCGVTDYDLLACRYKTRALTGLGESLANGDDAEENVLTCVLLSSFEIMDGSRPEWTCHAQGALALLRKFSCYIAGDTASFATRYYVFRLILMQTTKCHPAQIEEKKPISQDHHPTSPEQRVSSNSHGDELGMIPRVTEVHPLQDRDLWMRFSFGHSIDKIDVHTGCSSRILQMIDRITRFSSHKRQQHDIQSTGTFTMSHLQREAEQIKATLDTHPVVDSPNTDQYLYKSAESFRVATRIYFLLVCCDVSIDQIFVKDYLHCLISLFEDIVREGQHRRSFPMWPLFIAACVSTLDEERGLVLGFFHILSKQWPVSNVEMVMGVLETIWKARDINQQRPDDGSFDWQEFITSHGWKLSLS